MNTWGDKHNHLIVTCSYHTSLSFFIAGKGGETGGQKRLAQQQVCAEIHIV